MDSTYGLVRLLHESNDEVFAHHISRYARDDTGRNMTRTAAYEDRAVRQMLPAIQRLYRPFAFTQSAVNLLALSMLVITALVGTRELGQEVYIALTKADTGRGIVAGLCVAFIAIITDRLIHAGVARSRQRLGLE